jgi:hypothetical protein
MTRDEIIEEMNTNLDEAYAKHAEELSDAEKIAEEAYAEIEKLKQLP